MDKEALVTFVAPAFMEEWYDMVFIDSMLAQTDSNWKALIIHNGPPDDSKGFKVVTDRIKYDPRFIVKCSEENSGNWGTKNRQWAIDECDTSWIIQTSISDYWLPQAVQYINDAITKTDCQIAYWNSINHVVGPCLMLDGQLAWSKCDWGQFALKTWIAKKVGIKRGDVYCGDWAFVEDVLKSGYIKKSMKLPIIATVHN